MGPVFEQIPEQPTGCARCNWQQTASKLTRRAGPEAGFQDVTQNTYLNRVFNLVGRAGGNAGGGSVKSLLTYWSVRVFKWRHRIIILQETGYFHLLKNICNFQCLVLK